MAEKAKVAINNRLKSTDKLIESPSVVDHKEFLKQQHPFRQVHTYIINRYIDFTLEYGQILNTKLGPFWYYVHSKLCRSQLT